MESLYKRNGIYWIDVTAAGGKRIRRSAETSDKKAAKEYHDKVKAEAWRIEKLDEKPTRTWDEAAVRFLREAESLASYEDYKRQVAFWTEHFRGVSLERIERHRAADLIEQHAKNPATRNRYVACLRAVLLKAAGSWGWLDRAPKFKTYSEPKIRIRWLTPQEATQLLLALPAWLASMARFALATGLRQHNVLTLEWSQIDLQRRVAWIHPDQAKARVAIGIPLNKEALQVLEDQKGKHKTRVFLDSNDEPMDQWPSLARYLWAKACNKTHLRDFRWHDLRHTWASWLAQAGTPLYVLQELGGWQTIEMVKKYAHLSPEHLRAYADRLPMASHGTNTAQQPPAVYA